MRRIKFRYRYIVLIAIVALLILLIVFFPIFRQLAGVVLVSFIISYTLKPLQKFFISKGIRRKTAAILTIGIVVVFLGAVLWVLVPWIYNESDNFAEVIGEAQIYLKQMEDKFASMKDLSIFKDIFYDSYDRMQIMIQEFTNNFFIKLMSAAEDILLLFIMPTLIYFFLSDGDNISLSILKYIPLKDKYEVRKMADHIDKVMERYIITQLELCGIIAVLTYIVLLFSGIKYPMVLALLNGIFNIIPYFGPLIGALPIVLMALLSSGRKALVVIVWLFIIQQLEGDIICPKILGETVNSHPVTILLLLIIGGSVGGILGMILVIPLWTMAKIILSEMEAFLY